MRLVVGLLSCLVVVLTASVAPANESWATSRARERVATAERLAGQGEVDGALASLREALTFDPTFTPAYVALGRLHASRGDLAEAELVLAHGLERTTGDAELVRARGRVRKSAGRLDEAARDLELAARARPHEADGWRELLAAHVEGHNLAAALGVVRRLVSLARETADSEAERRELVRARALGLLVAELDPVSAGGDRGLVRAALAVAARPRLAARK
jgi:tetratricopeptide (TPR) repeat protein